MEFKTFLETYPIANWLWELFKGVSPLIVAIITIWINGNREKKKYIQLQEKQKELNLLEKNKARYNELKRDIDYIVDKVMDLNVLIWDSGKDMLNMIQNAGNEKEQQYFNSFMENNMKMHILSRKLNSYVDIKIAYHEIKDIDFSSIFEETTDYASSLLDILKFYNSKAGKTIIKEQDNLLDEVQKKLIETSQKLEYSLVYYSVSLNNVLKRTEYYKSINDI